MNGKAKLITLDGMKSQVLTDCFGPHKGRNANWIAAAWQLTSTVWIIDQEDGNGGYVILEDTRDYCDELRQGECWSSFDTPDEEIQSENGLRTILESNDWDELMKEVQRITGLDCI